MTESRDKESGDTVRDTGFFSPFAAGYEAYPQNFSNKYFSAYAPQDEEPLVVQTVRRLISRGFTRDNLRWGYYQKYASPNLGDPNDWGGDSYFKNWESSVEDAREALAKIPVEVNRPGPDPDNPKVLAKNMLEHLDTVVKIALFDKHLAGHPNDPGIGIEVVVGTQGKKSRRHKVSTEWRVAKANHSDPKYKYDRLTITMTCPLGGWIGTAVWKYAGAAKFTRYVARYKVPDAPDSDGQIIFIFNGLESMPALPTPGLNPPPPAILQPVLQWTDDGWAVRSWYVPATYTPSMDMMPAPDSEKLFTTASQPAWTKAISVDEGTYLWGFIEWDGMSYHCWFEVEGDATKMVELVTLNILPLTYPVAVIEAYGWDEDDELVEKVKMKQISLERSDVPGQPVEPTWTLGSDDPPEPGAGKSGNIHYGTGRMQKYRVKATDNGATLTFTRKEYPKAIRSADSK